MSDAAARAAARQIEAYLTQHPSAADTAEGIAQWWVPPGARPALATVEQALSILVDAGVLVRRVLPDGRRVYAAANAPSPSPPASCGT